MYNQTNDTNRTQHNHQHISSFAIFNAKRTAQIYRFNHVQKNNTSYPLSRENSESARA